MRSFTLDTSASSPASSFAANLAENFTVYGRVAAGLVKVAEVILVVIRISGPYDREDRESRISRKKISDLIGVCRECSEFAPRPVPPFVPEIASSSSVIGLSNWESS
ncbi:hypothetical protein F2Q70_00003748 [Brassica cretica]|uniref:Uncharacterized protein n=1 Tax=Brassica cretica TaxID=69181 RepID=A0A8S9IJF9_BRACR|nr:hypothetical protein F2Q70_00003748 [Brassica cretica]